MLGNTLIPMTKRLQEDMLHPYQIQDHLHLPGLQKTQWMNHTNQGKVAPGLAYHHHSQDQGARGHLPHPVEARYLLLHLFARSTVHNNLIPMQYLPLMQCLPHPLSTLRLYHQKHLMYHLQLHLKHFQRPLARYRLPHQEKMPHHLHYHKQMHHRYPHLLVVHRRHRPLPLLVAWVGLRLLRLHLPLAASTVLHLHRHLHPIEILDTYRAFQAQLFLSLQAIEQTY
jgi:hypothetical protein